ncbi:MAG TPA: response regulator [bacterium]|nr:response regulator [bacterium]
MENETINVLLIEDNEADVRLIKTLLSETMRSGTSAAVSLTTAGRLAEGLARAGERPFDVILLDLSLPDSQGLETFRRTHERESKVPLIVLSGLDDESLALQAVREGAQDYLSKGEVTGYLLIRAIRYAIERKRTEETLKATNRKLRELDRLKSEFLSTVSHELRTPIAIMHEGVSLVLDGVAGQVTDMQRELLADTLENVDRLTRLVTDLLDISKIEAGKLRLRRSRVDINEILKKIYTHYLPQAKQKGIRLECEIPEGPVFLFADADKLMQIFNNLVSNAIRFTETTGTITIGATDREADVLCRVSDTGIGISRENQRKLFHKFEQFGRVDGPGYKGTGLGLAIAKGLVEKHDGRIWVESALKEGTTFWFTLKKIPFPTILIVDDDEPVTEVIREFLQEDGYEFVVSRDGCEAVERIRAERPSLVILDMRLPGMSGYEVIGRLKHDTRTQNIPIIIISAFSVDEEKLGEVDAHSAIPVVHKPFDRAALRNIVREMMVA